MAGAGGFAFDETLALCRRLWAAADELKAHVETRDGLAAIARKDWTGPHQVTFLRDLSTDNLLENSSVSGLEDAAEAWAQAWVLAMNAENEYLESQAVKDVGSSAPGESFVEEVPEFTPITQTPGSPDFEPTGGFYNASDGNWAHEGSSGGGSFGGGRSSTEFYPDDPSTRASANPVDLQEFVDGSRGIEQLFGPTIEGTQGHWRFVLNMAGEFVPADLKNPLFDCEDIVDAWKNRREFVTDVRRAFIKADQYDPNDPDAVLTISTSAVDRELREDDEKTEFDIQADGMIEQTAEELGVSEAEAERILVESLNEPFHGDDNIGPSIGDQAGGSDGDPATLAEILEAIDDGRIIIESQEPGALIDPSGNSVEDVVDYLQHRAVTQHLGRQRDAEGPSREMRETLRERFYEQNRLEEEYFGIPNDFDTEKLHEGLDYLGFIPVFGEVADGINGIIYTVEGDYVNAGISGLGLLPIGGQLATGTRVGKRAATEKVSKEVASEIARSSSELVESFVENGVVTHIVKNKNGELYTITETDGRIIHRGNHVFQDADGIWHHQPGARGKTVPDIPQRPPASAPNVEDLRLQQIMDTLYKGGYDHTGTPNPNRIGDGSAMDAARNEQFTGRETENAAHTTKVREQLTRLNKWLNANPNPSPDRIAALRLKKEIESLGGFK